MNIPLRKAATITAIPENSMIPEERDQEILSPAAVQFLEELHSRFESRRLQLLEARRGRQEEFDRGRLPMFLPDTEEVRRGDWVAAPIPRELLDRRVEITGPPDRKMVINALNSGASVFMADFEDSNAPT